MHFFLILDYYWGSHTPYWIQAWYGLAMFDVQSLHILLKLYIYIFLTSWIVDIKSKLASSSPKTQPAFQDGDAESDDEPLIPDAADVEFIEGEDKDRCCWLHFLWSLVKPMDLWG